MVYGFYFNDSFYEVLSQLSSDLSKWRVFNCVCEYMFEGVCDVQKLNKKELRVFEFILRKVNGGVRRVEVSNNGQANNKKGMFFGKKNSIGTNKNFIKVALATDNFASGRNFVGGLVENSGNLNRGNVNNGSGAFKSAFYSGQNANVNFEVGSGLNGASGVKYSDEGQCKELVGRVLGGCDFKNEVAGDNRNNWVGDGGNDGDNFEDLSSVVLGDGDSKNKEIGNGGNNKDFFNANENQQNSCNLEENDLNFLNLNENQRKSCNLNENGVNSIKTDGKNLKLVNLDENQRKSFVLEENDLNSINLDKNQRKSCNLNENGRNSMKISENHSKSASPYILIKQNKKHKNKLKLKTLKNNINQNKFAYSSGLSERGCFSYAKNLGDGAKACGDFVEGITLGSAGTSCSAVGGGFVDNAMESVESSVGNSGVDYDLSARVNVGAIGSKSEGMDASIFGGGSGRGFGNINGSGVVRCVVNGGVTQSKNFANGEDYRLGRVQSGSQMGNLEGVEFNKENAVEVNNYYSREFKPTSIDEVREEINKNNYKVDAEEFYYYYSSNGWQAGKSPILDWRAKLKDWDVRKRKVLQDYIDNTKIGSCKNNDKYTNSNERKYEGKDLSVLFDNLDDIVF